MFKTLFTTLFLVLVLTVPALAAQSVNPGCTFRWEEPLVDDPDNPGAKVGAWALAGDLDGFQFVTNDTPTWDPLKMYVIPKADRAVPCATVGVEALGSYVVMLKAVDTSANASPYTSLVFAIVLEDTADLSPASKVCMTGSYLGQAVEYCGLFDPIAVQ